MHSRPQLISSRLSKSYSNHDELVHSTIVRSYAALSNAGVGSLGGSSVLSSITCGLKETYKSSSTDNTE